MENKLYGKVIIWNGDSICAGNKIKGNWATRIAEKNSMICRNYAVGGGTIVEGMPLCKDGGERHCVSTSLERMYNEHPEADYIIFEGGTNDADLLENMDVQKSMLGSVDPDDFSGDYDKNTFCGALESVFYRALKYWTGKKIGYIVAQKMGTKAILRRRRRLYFEAAIEICEKWGIPCIDLWTGTYLNPCLECMYDNTKTAEENDSENKGFYTDGQHLTSHGYDYTSEIIENWLRTL